MPSSYNSKTTATQVASDLAANIRGKTILITGVTPNSLGSHFVDIIAGHEPARIILASRSQEKIDQTIAAVHEKHANVQLDSLIVDLASLKSVRAAADQIAERQNGEKLAIDVLLLNAGIMACDYGMTEDGFERQLGTNHLGHFVFANRIIPGMLASSPSPRVVVVSSDGHLLGPVRWADYGFNNGETYDRWRSYGQSKTANALYAWALAEKLGEKGLLAFSLHPGAINTNLGKHLDFEGDDFKNLLEAFAANGNPQGTMKHWETTPFKSLDEGTATHVFAAFADNLQDANGRMLQDAQVASFDVVAAWARNSWDANRLWKLSEELTGEKSSF